MNKLLFVSLLFFLFDCSSNLYVITTNDEYANLMINSNVHYSKYICINSSDSNSIIVKTASFLKKGNYDNASKYLSTINDKRSDDYLLSRALLNMFTGNFSEASSLLLGLSDTSNCLKILLYADCLSEKVKPIPIQDIIGQYQRALDCNYNDVNKDIMDIRIKLLKYMY
jgi:hypothetical protein